MSGSIIARMAVPSLRALRDRTFDPQLVQTLDDSFFSRNLYSRLFQLRDNGEIAANLASEFEWVSGTCKIKIRNDTRTVDGDLLSPYDVYLSLLRAVVRNNITHGSLRSLLCGPDERPNLASGCEGLDYDKEFVYLRPREEQMGDFLLPMLSSSDFAIIPRRALDMNSHELRIIDYRNSSGPYFVHVDPSSSKIFIEKNPKHFLSHTNMLTSVELVPAYGREALERFKNGDLDIITTLNGGTKTQFLDAGLDEENLHETKPIHLHLITVTPTGRRRHSIEDRLSAGIKLREAFMEELLENGCEPTTQFFSQSGEGRLTDVQVDQLNKVFGSRQSHEPKGRYIFGVHPTQFEAYQLKFRHLDFIELKAYELPPWTYPQEDQPDLFFNGTDTSFFENISLLNYNFAVGAFGDKLEGEIWMSDYMRTSSKAARLEKLNRLHFKILSDGYIFPIAAGPYLALARRPLQFSMSKVFAATTLWNLTKS